MTNEGKTAPVESAYSTVAALPLRILTQSLDLSPVGGIELCTLQDGLALRALGHQIHVEYRRDGAFRVPYEAAGISLGGPVDFEFRPRSAIRDLVKFAPSIRRARLRRPDVVWLAREEHLVWGQAVGRATGVPVVCHLHVLPALRHTRIVARGIAHFVAVSEFVRAAYIDEGIRPERISVLHNAIPPENYPVGGRAEHRAARARLGLPQSVPIVLAYGRMTTEKGIPTLLRAWRQLTRTRPDAVLVLVDAASEQDLVKESEVTLELRSLNGRSYRVYPMTHDVVPFLHAADVVVFPSLHEETFGRVVIEGMSTGRPVVASRIGAIPEILTGSMSRFLVTPGSVPELAANLNSLLDWRETEPTLGDACAEWITTRFPFGEHVEKLERILDTHRRVGP